MGRGYGTVSLSCMHAYPSVVEFRLYTDKVAFFLVLVAEDFEFGVF